MLQCYYVLSKGGIIRVIILMCSIISGYVCCYVHVWLMCVRWGTVCNVNTLPHLLEYSPV